MSEASSNWIDFFISLSPIGEALFWAGAICGVVYFIRDPLLELAKSIARRVSSGDDIVTPWGSITSKDKLNNLERISPSPADPLDDVEKEVAIPVSQAEWAAFRNRIYGNSRGVFLVHAISPSNKDGQEFDIFIYLKRHKSEEFSDIKSSEFFLGHYWGNKIFFEENKGKLIGIHTSAYGPFVCVAKIKFNDGSCAMVHRYIDFEMGSIIT